MCKCKCNYFAHRASIVHQFLILKLGLTQRKSSNYKYEKLFLLQYLHKDDNVPEPTMHTPSKSPARASLSDTIVFYCVYLLNLAVLAEVRLSHRQEGPDRSPSLDARILSCEALAFDQLEGALPASLSALFEFLFWFNFLIITFSLCFVILEAPSTRGRWLPSILLELHKKFVSRASRGGGSSGGGGPTAAHAYVAFRSRRWIDDANLAERATQELLLTEILERPRSADLAYLYDGPHVIESLLDRLSVVCPCTRENLERLVGGVSDAAFAAAANRSSAGAGASTTLASDAQQTANEKEERKRKAMERQRAILANMAEKQRKFLNQPVIQAQISSAEMAVDSGAPTPLPAAVRSTTAATSSSTTATASESCVRTTTAVPKPRESVSATEAEDTSLTCVICGQSQQLVPPESSPEKQSGAREVASSDEEDETQPLAMVAFVQQSSVLLQRPTALDAALHYRLPVTSSSPRTQSKSTADQQLCSPIDPSPNELRASLASRNLKNVYRLVARTLSNNFGQVRLLIQLFMFVFTFESMNNFDILVFIQFSHRILQN